MSEVKLTVSLNRRKNCVSVGGDGKGIISFSISSEELAKALKSFDKLKGRKLELTLAVLKEDLSNAGQTPNDKIIR